MPIRTRFAPSPTGYLHIGGVRTALFNWLFAKGQGGQFLLRIDDTDANRNVEEALTPILDGFRWLGIDWDEGPQVGGPHAPYYQSQRTDIYQQAVRQLLLSGAAYRDFAQPEEIAAQRDAAQQAGEPFTYNRQWMADTDARAAQFEAEGRTSVVRLKMPREGELILDDLVRGEVRFQWAREQDHVIQRADGSCLYHLATVVDDHAMEISHVIRAEEHLSNTPRQIFIAQQLGYALPRFAHLPYVAEPGSKHKLSKRKLDKYLKNREFAQLKEHGQRITDRLSRVVDADTFNPVIIDFYEQIGFLPDAILNYLLLLGWSFDASREDFTRAEMLEHFTLQRVNKGPASFDVQKLLTFQDRAMQGLPPKQKVAMMLPYLQQAHLVSDPPSCEVGPKVRQIVEAAGDRLQVAGDILDYTDFFTAVDQLSYDKKAVEKRLHKPEDAITLLTSFRDRLAQLDSFDVESVDRCMHQFVEAEKIKIGQIVHAVRVATTGKSVGFGIFDTLAILGREQTLARIDRVLRGEL